jgi:peptidoglycan/xylan/chitin deacetylase (PgdA/CDA1 family)
MANGAGSRDGGIVPDGGARTSSAAAGGADGGVKEPPKPIPIVLTFDDGPHAPENEAENHTLRIAKALNARQIAGAFFIQTHVKFRFDCRVGRRTIKTLSDMGHVIGIHTGSDESHVPHIDRVKGPAYDVDGDKKADGQNALESDLIRAKAAIQKVLGGDPPEFVRSVGLKHDEPVDNTYKRVNLKHIGVNVDSDDNGDNPRPTSDVVLKTLESDPQEGIGHAIATKPPHLIVLFHDINDTTAKHIDEYIDKVAAAVKANDRAPEFTSSKNAVLEILRATKL